jgi:phosphoketolase
VINANSISTHRDHLDKIYKFFRGAIKALQQSDVIIVSGKLINSPLNYKQLIKTTIDYISIAPSMQLIFSPLLRDFDVLWSCIKMT